MNSAAYKSLSDALKKVIIAYSGAETSAWLGKILGASSAGTSPTSQPSAPSMIDAGINELDRRGLDGKELAASARITCRIRFRELNLPTAGRRPHSRLCAAWLPSRLATGLGPLPCGKQKRSNAVSRIMAMHVTPRLRNRSRRPRHAPPRPQSQRGATQRRQLF